MGWLRTVAKWREIAPAFLCLIVLALSVQCYPVLPASKPATTASIAPKANSSTVPQTIQSGNQQQNPSGNVLEIRFGNSGYTEHGDWYCTATISPSVWRPGLPLNITTTLKITDEHLAGLAKANVKADAFCLLVTAERTFDAEGWLRQAGDERMSTLVTPTGLAIEGGIQGAATDRFGYGFRTPVDEFVVIPLNSAQRLVNEREVTFNVQTRLPAGLPPGIYRIRLDYGVVTANKRYYNLNCDAFARRSFFKDRPTESHIYSPPIPASGYDIAGGWVDASTIQPKIPWILLGQYNSNGYRGVVADEDKSRFALSTRNIIPDDVILPLYDDNKNKVSYSLEPQFPADLIEARSNIPWDYTKGELSIQVTGPDGKAVDLGTAPFVAQAGLFPTTKKLPFLLWKPSAYGQYTVTATGWVQDIWGNQYAGGGTYRFWIAKRMTLATATFQGVPYPVGSRYGRDIGFAPAVPADVEVNAILYVNSDPNNTKKLSFSGKASPSGLFTAAQGNKQLALDAPGEYYGHILAKYTDQDGHLWVSTMRHAGVVYPEDTPIIAHGKKMNISGKFVDRGETHYEGYVETVTNVNHLVHINFPYESGDVLLIASEQQGANKIEPVLTYDLKDKPAPYDPRFQVLGNTNVRLKTSNGYSPHLFPEYITEWAYYYAAAPRPGFMSRFLVGEDGVRAPYWPTSPNNFGGQINASNNGDLPGDIYRLIGGVVVKKKSEAPLYAGYMASAFILPKGTNNNRIIAPGAEDLIGADGKKSRLFLVGTRPGMLYETGTAFVPVAQIDPMLPAVVKFTLTYPDGKQVTTEGTGDRFGTCVGKDRWVLDAPGIYKYYLEADWQGYKGYMPGLPREGGEIYVIEKEQPVDATGLKLNLPNESSFPPDKGLTITGTSTAQTIDYAAVIPGAVIAQGVLQVNGGKFQYSFNPTAITSAIPTYDTVNLVNGKPEIKDVVHLTFFSRETSLSGKTYHSFVRLIIRGNRVLYTR